MILNNNSAFEETEHVGMRVLVWTCGCAWMYDRRMDKSRKYSMRNIKVTFMNITWLPCFPIHYPLNLRKIQHLNVEDVSLVKFPPADALPLFGMISFPWRPSSQYQHVTEYNVILMLLMSLTGIMLDRLGFELLPFNCHISILNVIRTDIPLKLQLHQ